MNFEKDEDVYAILMKTNWLFNRSPNTGSIPPSIDRKRIRWNLAAQRTRGLIYINQALRLPFNMLAMKLAIEKSEGKLHLDPIWLLTYLDPADPQHLGMRLTLIKMLQAYLKIIKDRKGSNVRTSTLP